MRRISLVSLSLLFVLALGVSLAQAQDDPNDETVRGTFISSRPSASLGSAGSSSSSSSSSGSKSTSSKSTSSKSNSSKLTNKTGSNKTGSNKSGSTKSGGNSDAGLKNTNTNNSKDNGNAKGGESVAIGLGYSLYMRDSLGRAVRVDPSRKFRAGESVRLNMESNIDGYLYIFHRENDGAPVMLFPDARLNGGENLITAHVPYEVPSSKEAVESNRWFTFDKTAAIENIYIIVTREPLPDTPTGSALLRYCTTDLKNCSVPVSATAWAKVEEGLKENVTTSISKSFGQAQNKNESSAVERGLSLTADDPAPSVVRMAVLSKTKTLVTAVALVHN